MPGRTLAGNSREGRRVRAASRGALWTPTHDDVDTLLREKAIREAARKRLIPFSCYLNPTFDPTPFHQLLAGALEMAERREITRLLVFAPVRHGKTIMTSQLFPAWYLGRNPNHEFVLASHSADLAEQNSFFTRNYLLEDRYRAVFGDRSPYDDPRELSDVSASRKHWRLRNHRGSLKAVGVGGSVTGFGADVFACDDPVGKQEQADSERMRQSVIAWFYSEAMTRLAPGGVMLICQARWHEVDISGHLLREQANEGEKWHVLRLPALAETAEQRREWCERNYVDPEHYLVSDRVAERIKSRGIRRRVIGALKTVAAQEGAA